MNKKNLEYLKNKLDEEIGDFDAQALAEIAAHSKNSATATDILKSSNLITKDIEDTGNKIVGSVNKIASAIKSIKIEVPKTQDVEVKNFPEPVTEVKVSNLKDIDFAQIRIPKTTVNVPKEVEIKKGWIQKAFIELSEVTSDVAKQISQKILKTKIVDTDDPKKPVSVRLSNGKQFYTAMMSVSGGGGVDPVRIKETSPKDASKNNPNFVLSFDAEDQLTQIVMGTAEGTYTRTITWVSNNPTAISSWS